MTKPLIDTKQKLIDNTSEEILRSMHHESMQQGANYTYTMLHNALEWEVWEGNITIAYANSLLSDMAHGIVDKKLTINAESAKLGIQPSAQLPRRRDDESARRMEEREANK